MPDNRSAAAARIVDCVASILQGNRSKDSCKAAHVYTHVLIRCSARSEAIGVNTLKLTRQYACK
jgi:hypothetical protein